MVRPEYSGPALNVVLFDRSGHFGRSDRNVPFHLTKIVVPSTALLYPDRKNNKKARGALGRVCATGMYRSIEHVKFPKFQTGMFVEWKAPQVPRSSLVSTLVPDYFREYEYSLLFLSYRREHLQRNKSFFLPFLLVGPEIHNSTHSFLFYDILNFVYIFFKSVFSSNVFWYGFPRCYKCNSSKTNWDVPELFSSKQKKTVGPKTLQTSHTLQIFFGLFPRRMTTRLQFLYANP